MFDMAPREPIMAARVADCGSTVAEGLALGISVEVFVAEGAKVAVKSGEGVIGLTSGKLVLADRGDTGGTGVFVTGKACETSPQARENRTIDNGKNLRTFNIQISFPKNCDCHTLIWQPDQ
jgi:hypothetical protein